MNFIEERLHIFDTVRQYLYEHDSGPGPVLPECSNPVGFEISKQKALVLNQRGLLGEFYKKIIEGTL